MTQPRTCPFCGSATCNGSCRWQKQAAPPGPHNPPGPRPGPNEPPPVIPDHLKPRREAPQPPSLAPSTLYPGMLSRHPVETVVRVSNGHKHPAAA